MEDRLTDTGPVGRSVGLVVERLKRQDGNRMGWLFDGRGGGFLDFLGHPFEAAEDHEDGNRRQRRKYGVIGLFQRQVDRRARFRGSGSNDAVRRDVEDPGKHQRDRKQQGSGDEQVTQRGIGNTPRGKEHRGDLDDDPRADDVHASEPEYPASSQFVK